MKNFIHYALAIALVIFALATLFMSSSIVFDWFGIREMEGQYVPFVVWANLICSVMYLIAVVEFFRKRASSVTWLVASAILLLIVFIGLALHIYTGGAYETKTVGAMGFRFVVTVLFAWAFRVVLRKKKRQVPDVL